MRLFGKLVRLCGATVVAALLAACGGIGDVGPAAENAQVSGGGGANAPSIQGTPRPSAAVGSTYSFQPAARDADGGALTFSAENLPAWLRLDPASGRLTGTPEAADIGTYSGITIRVSDGASNSALGPFSITVVAQGIGTASLSWMPPTSNVDGSTLTDLAGFVIVYGLSPTELTETIKINNPSVTTYVVEELTSGTWYFAVQAANTGGALSSPSDIASKTIS